ncbi:MAG TPA: hypothetical protein PK095_06055 [Myxococcota bacterium]|nr:hypothetical protein [Myxococcota bacterium]
MGLRATACPGLVRRGASLVQVFVFALLLIAAVTASPVRAQYADEGACLVGCGVGGSCAFAAGTWNCSCASGYRLSSGSCLDIDECIESYESAVFTSRPAYLAAVGAAQFDVSGVETFDNLGLDGSASANGQGITTSPTLGIAFEPLWPGLFTQQPVAFAVGTCGGAVSSGTFAMLNNAACVVNWAGPSGPPIRFYPLDPDVAIVGAGVFNASVDDTLIMRFYAVDGSVLISATIPAGAPAFVGVIAQVPATAVSIGPAPNNAGNGLIAFDNLEIATRPRGRVGGNLCGPDATCVNLPGTYECIVDDCPSDPDKTEPGVCGCGAPETDANQDGLADCGYGLCPVGVPLESTIACGDTGVCATTFGTRSCDIMTGLVSDDCAELLPEVPTETCDLVDNDCDGAVDEGFDTSCGPGLPRFYYAVVRDASGEPVGTIRCHETAGELDCDRDPDDPDQLRVYPELLCPNPTEAW